jgi:ribosomal protein L16
MKINYWIKRSKFKYSQKQLYLLRGLTKANYLIQNQKQMLIKTSKSIFLKFNQIEAGRRLIRHFLKKQCRILINLKFMKPVTVKSNGTRMGKGKGNVDSWVLPVNSGLIIYNFLFINIFQFLFLRQKIKSKLQVKIKGVVGNSMSYYLKSIKYLY